MALPTERTVRGKFTNPVTGRPFDGTDGEHYVIFEPYPDRWTDQGGNQILLGGGRVNLDYNGEFTERVVCTDASGVLPADGRLWRLRQYIGGAWTISYVAVPVGDGSTLDLTDILSVEEGDVVYVPVEGPRGPAGPSGEGGSLDTGISYGGNLTVNEDDPLSVDVAPFVAQIADYSTNPPTVTTVESTEALTVALDAEAQNRSVTWLLADADLTITQQADRPTATQRRTSLVLGMVIQDSGFIAAAKSLATVAEQPINQLYDLADALGPFSVSGNAISSNGSNLLLDRSAGQIFSRSWNRFDSTGARTESPHLVATDAATPVSWIHVLRASDLNLASATSTIDVGHYDNAGTLAPVGGSADRSVLHSLWIIPDAGGDDIHVLQYGQQVFDTLDDAVAAAGTASVVTNPNLPGNAVLLAYLAAQHGATDLSSSSQAQVIAVSAFGGSAGGGGGGGGGGDLSDYALLAGAEFTGAVGTRRAVAGDTARYSRATGDTQDRYRQLSDGTQRWGSGTATPDAELKRIAAALMAFLGTDLLVGQDGGKAFMIRQSGDELDLDASGSDLNVSVYELDDFAGDERQYLRLESSIQLAHAIGKWIFSNGPSGAAIHTIDGEADELGFHGASPVGRQTVTGGRSDGSALASLLGALNTLGLIDDASTGGQTMLAASNNLSELTSPTLARTSLGLGNSATLNVGTSSSTVAAGDDSRITGAAQKAQNLADLANAATARTNLGLGSSATEDVPAHVFDVTTYGAVGNGKIVADAAMTSGSAVLTSASGPFTSGDVGKSIMVLNAGLSNETLVGTISAYTSATQVTLSATASSTVSGISALWATDDTAAIQAAVNAAATYALAHSYAATVYIPPAAGAFYGVAGSLVTGGSTLGNAQITLPVVPTTGRKMTLTIQGAHTGAGVQHWQQQVPNLTGSTLVSFGIFANSTAQTNSINAAGNPCVIGGPAQPGGYGVAPGVFSNLYVDIGDMSILTCHSKNGYTYSALDLSGIANAQIRDFAYSTSGAVAPPAASYQNPNTFASGLAIGVLLPASGNNDLTIVKNTTCGGGYTYGLLATEHCDIYGLRILYCWAALCPVGTYYNSVGAAHSIAGTLISIEQCTYLLYVFGAGTGGIGPTMYLKIDTETSTPRFGDRSSGPGLAAARGDIILAGLFNAANLTLDYPTGLRIRNSQLTYPSTAKTANYTAGTFDETVLADATSGAITITLPTAVGRTTPITVKKVDVTTNVVTVDGNGTQTIDGQLTKRLEAQWDYVTLIPYSGNWYATAAAVPSAAVWRRRDLPDPVVIDSLYAGAAPSISVNQTSTPDVGYIKYAPSGVTLSGSDVTGPFTYLGASGFQIGSGTPDSTYVLPTSRYPNTRGSLSSSQSVWSVEFGTNSRYFQLRFNYQTAGMYRLSIDGRKVADLMTAMGGTTPGSTHLMTVDLGSALPRVIRFDFYTVPFGGIYLPPDASMWATVPRTDRFMVFGDSISDGSSMNTGGGAGTWAHRAARFLGSNNYWNESRGGTGYITAGAFATLADRVAVDVVGLSPNRLVVWAGYNDNSGSQSAIAAAATSLYSTIRAGLPNTEVYIIGCWSPTGSPASSITNTDTTLRTAAAAAGYPFISPITGSIYNAAGALVATHGAWITGTGRVGAPTGVGNADYYIGTDAVHPTDEGHVYLARRISAAIRELMPA